MGIKIEALGSQDPVYGVYFSLECLVEPGGANYGSKGGTQFTWEGPRSQG